MPLLHQKYLELDRCPHCSINRPALVSRASLLSVDHAQRNQRQWACYSCENCGGVVTACASRFGLGIREIYPSSIIVDEAIPNKAKEFLKQAISTIHAPAGSVMLSASAVDAMLKEKGYDDGSLYKRIESAVNDHIITADMAKWAHEVRLDANDQRHADTEADLPDENDAKRIVAFTQALAEFLFVLPNKVQRGIDDANK